MGAFLSDEWFQQLSTKAALITPPAGIEMVIEQRINGDQPLRWQLILHEDGVKVDAPGNADADLRVTTDRETATSIHAGELSAQQAFLDGRVQIGGDIQAMMNHRETLTDLARLLVAD